MNVSEITFIITEKGTQIAVMFLNDFERGVTVLNGRGAYTGREKEVLLCAMKSQQTAIFQEKVKCIDNEAFVIFAESKSIIGNGFHIYR